ncbi:MAG: hypothetical protein AAB426_11655 [Myxococcota bacterium]
MPAYTEILRSLSREKFGEILAASSRQARETYFHRHSIRAGGAQRMPKPGAKNEMRTQALFDLLHAREDDELCEEVLRIWLLTHRPMLAAALDHLGIPHENGLTQGDVSKFEKLSAREIRGLIDVLKATGAPEDAIVTYLRFMGTTDVDKALR